ncbi:MAG: DciA family protein [Legionellales bacterium]
MRPITHCLNKQLTDLCQRSLQLEELSEKVALFLPQELAQNCLVGSFNKGCLVLTTTDAVWASQIRYAIPELRDRLRKEAGLYQLSSIKVSLVEPSILYEKPTKKVKYTLSDKAKASIISESTHCSYQPLKKALLHLADL